MESKSSEFSATLDARFHLRKLLSKSDHSALFLAEHGDGSAVFAKIVWEPDEFFDELARLFALEGTPWFCRCLHHYAPATATGKPVPFDRHPGDVFEPLAGLPADRLGVLIMEPVKGVPLETWSAHAHDLAKIDPLMDVMEALETLHDIGEVYGNVSSDRIWIEEETNEIKIPDLGPGKRNDDPFDPSTDVNSLAKLGLKLMKRPDRKLKRSFGKQTEDRSFNSLREELRRFRKKIRPRRNLEVLFGFMRPVHITAWMLMVLGASVMLSRLQGESQVFQRERSKILKSDESAEARVAALRGLLSKSGEETFRQTLIRDIGQILELDGLERFMPIEDLTRPIAVLDFGRNPVIIGREAIFRLGDRIRTDTDRGRIDAIEYNRFLLNKGNETKWYAFERPTFYTGQLFRRETALIWNNDHNLPRLLEALASMQGKSFTNQNANEGKLAGTFNAKDVDEFMGSLSREIDLEETPDSLILVPYETDLPVYVRLYDVSFSDKHIDEFQEWMTWLTGYPVSYDTALSGQRFDIEAFNTSWREMILSLGLSYEILQDRTGSKTLHLKEGAPPRDPSLN